MNTATSPIIWRPVPPSAVRHVSGRRPKPKPLDPARFFGGAPETDKSDSMHQTWWNPETETPQLGPLTYETLIGSTPLVDISGLLAPKSLKCAQVTLLAKVEYFNPSFSTEDRVVRFIMDRAESAEDLCAEMNVVVTGSYNVCVSTAMTAAMRGFGCVVCCEATLPREAQDSLKAYGARVVTSPPEAALESDSEHPVNAARRLCAQHPDLFFYINDYEPELWPDAHYQTLGPEIWSQTNGTITHFVSRGAPLIGAGRFLREKSADKIETVAVETAGSCFARFVDGSAASNPPEQQRSLAVTDQACLDACCRLAREEGICAGALSGINVAAALEFAHAVETPSVIVVDLPDLGVHFLSSVFNKDWVETQGLRPPADAVVPGCLDLQCPGCSRGLVCPRPGKKGGSATRAARQYTGDFRRYEHLIGNTPLIDLSHLVDETKSKVRGQIRVFAKCEMFNPGFSIKDRIARNILDRAESAGVLRPGMCVVAASSGNTGASTAMLCAMRGYAGVITTDQKCSKEKMDAIRAYGATLMVSPSGLPESNPDHYMNVARRLCAQNPGLFFDVDQYDSKSNPEGHYLTLGPEIYEQTGCEITHFVAAGSTGGTVSGVGKYLKETNPKIKVVLADPVGSVFTNYFRDGEVGTPGKYLVEGVGKGSIPGAMDMDLIDAVLPVTDRDAFLTCSRLSREEGVCPGGSSGLNVFAALKFAEQIETVPATIVTVMPDLGVKYMSKVYNPEWLLANKLEPPPVANIYGLPPAKE